MKSDMLLAIEQISNEKGLSMDILASIVEEAIAKAYKKHYDIDENIESTFDRETGEIKIIKILDVVDEVMDGAIEISLEDARKIDPQYELGDQVHEISPFEDLGRIAAQTAKQVISTKIGEAERELILAEYSDKLNELITGKIHRRRGDTYYVDIGRTEAIMLKQDQNPIEHYSNGRRFKFVISEIRVSRDPQSERGGGRGPQILVSRTSANLIRLLFAGEVPEIESGEVEIMAVSREAGSRTKISVYAENPELDPVGACVGPKGIRVENIVEELRGEKIDVVEWNENPAILIANSLSPAQVMRVEIYDEDKAALVVVPEDQLSVAIGKEGQNARLAARLTGWKIDIKDEGQYKEYLRSIGEYEEVYGEEVYGEELYGEEVYDEEYYEDEDHDAYAGDMTE